MKANKVYSSTLRCLNFQFGKLEKKSLRISQGLKMNFPFALSIHLGEWIKLRHFMSDWISTQTFPESIWHWKDRGRQQTDLLIGRYEIRSFRCWGRNQSIPTAEDLIDSLIKAWKRSGITRSEPKTRFDLNFLSARIYLIWIYQNGSDFTWLELNRKNATFFVLIKSGDLITCQVGTDQITPFQVESRFR